jgi:hypothetical protein
MRFSGNVNGWHGDAKVSTCYILPIPFLLQIFCRKAVDESARFERVFPDLPIFHNPA